MSAWIHRQYSRLNHPVDILPLVIFRVAFGLLMLFSTVRFVLNGWVRDFYIDPLYHFTYLGFNWIQPLQASGMFAVFVILGILSILIALGLFYRVSMLCFFLLFTYVELIDKTYYLNHYYFISVMSLLMLMLPLHRKFSVDSWLLPSSQSDYVASWMVSALRLMVAIVYIYAGLAKLTSDWMLHALPLRIWLPIHSELPMIGTYFDKLWVAYAMSWAGAIYDLTIPIFLIWRRSRPFAYLLVIVFHVMTAFLFNIGVFPWVMIASTLVFFEGQEWRWLAKRCHIQLAILRPSKKYLPRYPIFLILVGIFFLWQLLMPFRHWLYQGNHLWTNEGYRFAWHVMLIEKNGTVIYRIEDPDSDRFWIVYPNEYLTAQQEQQMSFQPDMMLQFAHFLADEYRQICICEPMVYADTYVSLNLRSGQAIIDPDLNLVEVKRSLYPAWWIVPLE